ncbi:MAG: hypothetical protein ACM32O_19050 [Clostridia bacterium]
MLTLLLALAAVISIIGFILTIRSGNNQGKPEETNMGSTMQKHRILGNPVAIAYLIGFAVWGLLLLVSLIY